VGWDSNPPYGHGGVTSTARDPAALVRFPRMTTFRDNFLPMAGALGVAHHLLTV